MSCEPKVTPAHFLVSHASGEALFAFGEALALHSDAAALQRCVDLGAGWPGAQSLPLGGAIEPFPTPGVRYRS